MDYSIEGTEREVVARARGAAAPARLPPESQSPQQARRSRHGERHQGDDIGHDDTRQGL